jgi:formyltetrahydrofolate deformylase
MPCADIRLQASGRPMKLQDPRYILKLSCTDTIGIVQAISGALAESGCNIITSAQYGDASTERFFMRVAFAPLAADAGLGALRDRLAAAAGRFGMEWSLHPAAHRMRVVVMVSRFGHCLNDLLYRAQTDALPMAIAAIVSNHADFARLAASYDIPFHHLPVSPATKADQEARLAGLLAETRAELVILARYMQVLSDAMCTALAGRAINIHHSFLPSFKGAAPYTQAFERGVKLIGATAHYVTPELDEGPIIEQAVERVGHEHGPAELAAIGRDTEATVLARAVKFHLEHRVLLNGTRTVVFR